MSSESPLVFGILAAMPMEIAELEKHVQKIKVHKFGKVFTLTEGKFQGNTIVYGLTNVGMVAASSVTTLLISGFNVDAIIFTGVAGGIKAEQKVGDIVIANDVINYDMNCTALEMGDTKFKRGELPFLRWREYQCSPALRDLAMQAPEAKSLPITVGRVVSGSEFVVTPRKIELASLWKELNDPLCVEMEGAAVAQICHSFSIPFLLIRALSDTLEGDSSADFAQFCTHAAAQYWPLLQHILTHFHVHHSNRCTFTDDSSITLQAQDEAKRGS